MYTFERCLVEHPLALLRVIAQLRGIALHGRGQREVAAELAAALSDPAAVAQGLAELSPEAMGALEALAAAGGRMPVTLFEERYGEIRLFGSGRLAREKPWESPTGPAEELWYQGWIFRGFTQTEEAMVAAIILPDEILGLLPRPNAMLPTLQAASPPPVVLDQGDAFVQDVATFLAVILVDGLHRRRGQWHLPDVRAFVDRLLVPEPEPLRLEGNGRLALLLHLVERLRWLREEYDGRVKLQAHRVREWLDMERPAQWLALWIAWRDDDAWDDLRRLPELLCEGGWHDDPVGARRRLLDVLIRLQPDTWYRIDDWIAAVRQQAPEFLRPDGDYDSWYIRRADGEEYLRGVEHWDDVEGRLLRYLLTGPFHWLGAIDLDADRTRFKLTEAGVALIQGVEPPARPAGKITVESDFTVLVPSTVPCSDRVRVARFAMWLASPTVGSEAPFRYRITRRSLRRAERQGITVSQILAFLREHVEGTLPPNVVRALERWPTRRVGGQEAP